MVHRTRVASTAEARKAITETLAENREVFKRLAEYDLGRKEEVHASASKAQKRKS